MVERSSNCRHTGGRSMMRIKIFIMRGKRICRGGPEQKECTLKVHSFCFVRCEIHVTGLPEAAGASSEMDRTSGLT